MYIYILWIYFYLIPPPLFPHIGENVGEEPVILTDILGLEDALGTMDFKVAGNESGITTFQLDIKSEGLTMEIIEKVRCRHILYNRIQVGY
jgi:hypothetical protein